MTTNTSSGASSTADRIRPRDRDAIVNSLRAGVVPRAGQQHIQVGRVQELNALLTDVDRIADTGSAARFVIGEYGSGKTFFLNLVRSVALQQKLVTVHADLSPDRRLHATGGQARSLYSELMRNMSTRAKPDGGAMGSVVERFVTIALAEAQQTGRNPDAVIRLGLNQLTELTSSHASQPGAYTSMSKLRWWLWPRSPAQISMIRYGSCSAATTASARATSSVRSWGAWPGSARARISTLSNSWARSIPRVSRPADPASRR